MDEKRRENVFFPPFGKKYAYFFLIDFEYTKFKKKNFACGVHHLNIINFI